MAKYAGFALAAVLLLQGTDAHAQCAITHLLSHQEACGATPGDEQLLPEDGYLTADRYTSRFFGFSLDLPISSDGHRITIPVMLEKQHALLAIGFEQGKRFGTLTITAEESPEELERYDDIQGEQCSDAGGVSSQMRRPIPGGVLRYGAFYANVHHWHAVYADHFWVRVKNYIIRVSVDSNDQDFLQKSKHALTKADFYCVRGGQFTTNNGKAVTFQGEPYRGPTVPTWLADAAIKDPPGLNIPGGTISGGIYSNPDLGLQYSIPAGWNAMQEEVKGDPPQNARDLREYQVLHACSRTLLRAVQGADGDSDEQNLKPSISLRALDPDCLSLRTPSSIEDKEIAREVAANLELFSEFGEIKTHRISSQAGRVFVVLQGTIGQHPSGEVFSRRMSEMLFATQQRNLILVWSLMAPTSADLEGMPASHITFDDSKSIRLPLPQHPESRKVSSIGPFGPGPVLPVSSVAR